MPRKSKWYRSRTQRIKSHKSIGLGITTDIYPMIRWLDIYFLFWSLHWKWERLPDSEE